MSSDRKRLNCPSLPDGWTREVVKRKSGLSAGRDDIYYYSQGVSSDASLVPPIRQTTNIFKQPVTVRRSQEGEVKTELKHGPQDKPKQLFWEKRLEGLKACNIDSHELRAKEVHCEMKLVAPHVNEETLVESEAKALHGSIQPITDKTDSTTSLDKSSGVYNSPNKPLVQALSEGDEDMERQEDTLPQEAI